MGWWKRLPLSSRVYFIVVLLGFISLSGGITTIWYAGRFGALVTTLIDADMESLTAARELEAELANQKGFVTYYFLDGDYKWLEQLESHRRMFRTWLKRAQAADETPEGRKILSQIEEKYEEYVRNKDLVISLYNAGKRDEGEEMHWEVRKQFFVVNELCSSYNDLQERGIGRVKQRAALKVRTVTSVATILMGFSLLLSATLIFFMGSQIISPLRRLASKASVSGGELVRGDEVRSLSREVDGLIKDADRTRTELEASRERLQNSEKMALVGKLATEVAHSIRNPMTSIKMRLFSLERSLDLKPAHKEDFDVVSEEMLRLDNIVRNFLEFSRPHRLNKSRMDIRHVVDMTLELLAYRLEMHDVKVDRMESGPLPQVEADPELMKEVLVNLVVNACEAIGKGGKITITEEEAVADGIGAAIVVRVADDGPGIPEDILANVFEPFFTSKETGTGLGLSIASRIMEEHGGRLEVTSRNGDGTTFIVIIPASEGGAA